MVLLKDSTSAKPFEEAFEFPNLSPEVVGFNSVFYDGGYSAAGTPVNANGSAVDQYNEFNAEYRAWKVAQWAANVADFRDADGIMTRFDYDPNPFDGWDCDLTDPRTFRTVWGMERPELTLEESFAIHDRRVRDTNQDTTVQLSLEGADGSATRGDDDMDQYRIPQGSLFLELKAARSPIPIRIPNQREFPTNEVPQANSQDNLAGNAASYPLELYGEISAGNYGLNVGLMAPAGPTGIAAVPVWRVAISEAHAAEADAGNGDRRSAFVDVGTGPRTVPFLKASSDFLLRPVGSQAEATLTNFGVTLDQNRDTSTMQPESPEFFETIAAGSPEQVQRQHAIDRVIVMTPGLSTADVGDIAATTGLTDAGQIYYNRFNANQYATHTGPANQLFVENGGHLVIGPRDTTYLGSRKLSMPAFRSPMEIVVSQP